ncbi:glutathione S-transferase domain-containing protein [Calothrix sp. NIES-4071]|nr:glutathione S-transferase domain-containing protein [Calothrix sp. NIES-4071]BAZ62161.1 glutathione S-transferase domain-containing protein [Calothrix sp. NIES-4105]
MLKLYLNPISPHSRRVLVALLEKEIEAELVELELNAQSNRPELLAINPFHHIPVLEDDGFRIVESFAILDYLEAKYPEPSLLPRDARNLAKVRMVQMVTVNELLPGIMPMFPILFGLPVEPEKIEQTQKKVSTVLAFFEDLLGEQTYFAGEQLTLAEVTAGTVVSSLHLVGLSLENHPKLSTWLENLNQRPAWVKSLPTQEAMEKFKSSRARLAG